MSASQLPSSRPALHIARTYGATNMRQGTCTIYVQAGYVSNGVASDGLGARRRLLSIVCSRHEIIFLFLPCFLCFFLVYQKGGLIRSGAYGTSGCLPNLSVGRAPVMGAGSGRVWELEVLFWGMSLSSFFCVCRPRLAGYFIFFPPSILLLLLCLLYTPLHRWQHVGNSIFPLPLFASSSTASRVHCLPEMPFYSRTEGRLYIKKHICKKQHYLKK